MSPDPRGGCAQGWLLGTYQGRILSTRDPSLVCVLGTQSPDWPNGPTDSAPRGRWRDLQRGEGASPYIYFVKNNNNNKFV